MKQDPYTIIHEALSKKTKKRIKQVSATVGGIVLTGAAAIAALKFKKKIKIAGAEKTRIKISLRRN